MVAVNDLQMLGLCNASKRPRGTIEKRYFVNPKKIWRAVSALGCHRCRECGRTLPEAAVPRIATCDRRCVFRVRALYLMVFELGVCTLGVTCVLHVFASGELLSSLIPYDTI